MRGRFYDTTVVEVERERFPTEFDFTSSRNTKSCIGGRRRS